MSKYQKRGVCDDCGNPVKAMCRSKYCYSCTLKRQGEDDA